MSFGDFLRGAAGPRGRAPARGLHPRRGRRGGVDHPPPAGRPPAVLARLDEARALVERYQPWRLAHLRADVRELRVVRFACRGAFFPADRAVVTELTFLARRDITAAPVASSVVHEGVHARVHAMAERFGWARAWDMAREERLCRRAELAFGRALPQALGAPVVERALATLAMDDRDVAPAVDWRAAEARIGQADRKA